MVDWKLMGNVYGSDFIAKGGERLFIEIDRYAPAPFTGVDPLRRLSTYLNMGLGLGLPIVGEKLRVSTDNQNRLTYLGGHMFSQLWNYLEEYLAGMGGGAGAGTPRGQGQPSGPVQSGVGTGVGTPRANSGRYQRV